MTTFDFQLPEPGLVTRIRNAVHAHQADNAVRDRLARRTTVADDAADDQERRAIGLTDAPLAACRRPLEKGGWGDLPLAPHQQP